MSNHTSQKTIQKHHRQIEQARLKKLKSKYEREHKKELHRREMRKLVREMRKLEIAWQVFKAIYFACIMLILLSASIYAIKGLYGF